MTHTSPVRITICGPCGSGKSTLASRIASKLDVGFIDLDSCYFKEHWETRNEEELEREIDRRLNQFPQGWVIAGNHSKNPIHWENTEIFVYLNLPFYITFWRLLKRTMYRFWTKQPLFGTQTCIESFRLAFASSESVLLWAIQYQWYGKPKMMIDRLETYVSSYGKTLHVLSTTAEVERLVESLQRKKCSYRRRKKREMSEEAMLDGITMSR
jgi:adenylate kinase family enzyme